MQSVNAIAKARFSSAKPQRVQVSKGQSLLIEMLCFEPGQKLSINDGEHAYYVITGTAEVSDNGEAHEVPTNHVLAAPAGQKHMISAAGDQRLICLSITSV